MRYLFMKVSTKASEKKVTQAFTIAVRTSIRENQAKGKPVCGYDLEKRKSYILYPNGEKVYAEA